MSTPAFKMYVKWSKSHEFANNFLLTRAVASCDLAFFQAFLDSSDDQIILLFRKLNVTLDHIYFQ